MRHGRCGHWEVYSCIATRLSFVGCLFVWSSPVYSDMLCTLLTVYQLLFLSAISISLSLLHVRLYSSSLSTHPLPFYISLLSPLFPMFVGAYSLLYLNLNRILAQPITSPYGPRGSHRWPITAQSPACDSTSASLSGFSIWTSNSFSRRIQNGQGMLYFHSPP